MTWPKGPGRSPQYGNSQTLVIREVSMRPAAPCVVAVALLTLACGGADPLVVDPLPTVPATLAPTPSPSPSPAPTARPDGPPRHGNGQTVVANFKIWVFSVANTQGELRPYNAGDPIYIGETVRFDCQAKDHDGVNTNGRGESPRWDWGPDELALLSSTKEWNPRARVTAPGIFRVDASLDGVDAATLTLEFRRP
jgi:hypothetical protein